MVQDFPSWVGGLWTTDRGGLEDLPGRNGEPPSALHLQRVAFLLTACGALQPRTLFCQALRQADRTLVADPLMRFVYMDNYPNGRYLRSRLLYRDPYLTGGAPSPLPAPSEFRPPLSGGEIRILSESGQLVPDTLYSTEVSEAQSPSGGIRDQSVGSTLSFDTIAYALDQVPHPNRFQIDTAWGAGMNWERFMAGNPVNDAPLTALMQIEDRLWRTFRHNWAAWSSVTFTAGQARSVTGTTFENLIENTAGEAWGANRPGEIISAQYAGEGRQYDQTGAQGDRLGFRTYVLADATVNGGAVEFQSSLGTVGPISIFTGGAQWYYSTLLPISTVLPYDNVVIRARHTVGGETVRVWGWVITPEIP